MFDPEQPSIAVAMIVNARGELLIAWNSQWGCFTLPMTKIRYEPPAEKPPEAAVRAAAEVLGVPCRAQANEEARFFRGLRKSSRDAEIKDYQFHVVRVEYHPDFADRIESALWCSGDKLRAGEYQPLSGSVDEVLRHCIDWGWP